MEISIEAISIILSIVATILAIISILLSWGFYREGTRLYLKMRDLLAEIRETSGITKETTTTILDRVLDNFGPTSKNIIQDQIDQQIETFKNEIGENIKDIKSTKTGTEINKKIRKLEKTVANLEKSSQDVGKVVIGKVIDKTRKDQIIQLLEINPDFKKILDAMLDMPMNGGTYEAIQKRMGEIYPVTPTASATLRGLLYLASKGIVFDLGLIEVPDAIEKMRGFQINPEFVEIIRETL